jgi:flavin reductase (DIM6/NTAB) family NADH-FMN oxidoreductase RutF
MTLDNRLFRESMGRFATGITVMTARGEGMTPLGMTVNSFASLSLEPALVMWSIQNNSECLAAFEASPGFAANIQGSDQELLSRRFARKGDHHLEPRDYRIGRSGQPVLKGCLVSFECHLWRRYEGGDHTIIIGRVVEMEARPTGKPLLFYGGQYHEVR